MPQPLKKLRVWTGVRRHAPDPNTMYLDLVRDDHGIRVRVLDYEGVPLDRGSLVTFRNDGTLLRDTAVYAPPFNLDPVGRVAVAGGPAPQVFDI